MIKIGPTQQKILLVLLGGAVLGFAGTPTRYYRFLKVLRKEWRRIDQQSFTRSVRSLCHQKLLEEKLLPNGSVKLQLTSQGQRYAQYQHYFGKTIHIKHPKQWDGWWRLVLFDIPEKHRVFRDILRNHLKQIGFQKLQHSVFIFPHPCEQELSVLTELYNATPYVRIVTAHSIDNQKEIMKKFSLT